MHGKSVIDALKADVVAEIKSHSLFSRPKAGSPLIVIPTEPSGAIVLEVVKV